MTIEAMKLALEVLTDKGQLHPDDYKEKKNESITALRTAIEQADEQEAWKTSDTAYRPGGLPQDFTKHEVDSASDWSEWVCPDPTQYFMKCCDCGLVHEMQFNVVKYSEGDKCEDFDDPHVQAVFRARRTTPPAAQPAPVQEPVTEAQKRADFERFWVTEIGDKDDLTYGGLGYAINRVAVAWKAWKAAAQPCPYIRSTAEGTHHCALANQTKEQA
jgi:hypothetical protein